MKHGSLLSMLVAAAVFATAGPAAATVRHPSWRTANAAPAEEAALSASTAAPVAVAARVKQTGDATQVTFDLSAKVAVSAFVIERPDRLIIDLPEVNFQIPAEAGRLEPRGVGVVRSFRFGLFAPGKSRIVIDLAAPVVLRRAVVEPVGDSGPARLVIELAKTDRAVFRLAARHAAAEAALPAAPALPPSPTPVAAAGKPVIVIDPGHGGIDPGASGVDGTLEKQITLDFANALAARLQAQGRYSVVLTRTGDTFVSLSDRVHIARDAEASLLISIHADTLSSDHNVTGATVYTVSDRASDAEAARVAEEENHADDLAGLEAQPEAPGISDILFDLTRRETRTYAHLFQRTLVGYWQKIARLNRNPERSAGFKVLQAPDVPSVLLELGYLSSERDARSLGSAQWRDQAAGSVAAAVDAFFAARSGPEGKAKPEASTGGPLIVSVQPHP